MKKKNSYQVFIRGKIFQCTNKIPGKEYWFICFLQMPWWYFTKCTYMYLFMSFLDLLKTFKSSQMWQLILFPFNFFDSFSEWNAQLTWMCIATDLITAPGPNLIRNFSTISYLCTCRASTEYLSGLGILCKEEKNLSSIFHVF